MESAFGRPTAPYRPTPQIERRQLVTAASVSGTDLLIDGGSAKAA